MGLIPIHTRTFKDSGDVTYTNTTAVPVGTIYVFTLDDRFKPYNQSSFINNSSNNINIEFNYKSNFKEIVPKGNQRTFQQFTEDIRFKNSGTTEIAIGEISITIRNTGWKGEKLKENVGAGASLLGNVALIKGFFK